MTYLEWFESHANKHQKIIKTLTHLSDDEVIDYSIYENMQKNHTDFCPLYKENKKCHEMEELNCYFCACNHFRFSDSGLRKKGSKILYSLCNIDAKEGREFESNNAIHQDCSACLIPHKRSVIKKYFSRNWQEVMAQTISCNSNIME
jgi:HJR/Mrr/RecB family endonuclease